MKSDILFDSFLENLKRFDKPLIEAIQQGKALIEAEQPKKFVDGEDYSIVHNSLDSDGGDIIIDATIPWNNFPEQKQKVIEIMKAAHSEYEEEDQDAMLEESKISVKIEVTGNMVADGDHTGDWYYFEPDTETKSYVLITPVTEIAIKEGEGFDPVIAYANEAIESAYSNSIDAIGEDTYKYRPSNRWAYGATH